MAKSNAERQAAWRRRQRRIKAENRSLKRRLAVAERMLAGAMRKLKQRKKS
jgi:hypothetical protein